MQALFGSLFALAAGILFYLASPRQRLVASIRRRGALVAAGALCCLAGAVFWHGCVNWPAALCATVGALAASLSGMPFVGMMAGRRAKLASPSAVNADTRASTRTGRPTGTP
jgi:hypothetical protein